MRLPLEWVGEFCQRWQIREFALFGSILRADFRPESDVDVLVTFAPEAQHSMLELVQMEEELKELFGRDVDVVEKAGLVNPFRRAAILREMQVIYAA